MMALSLFIPIPSSRRHPRLLIRSSSTTTSFDLRSYWSTLLTEINASLSSAIPIVSPTSIHTAMRHSVLSPSAKRASPLLCIAAAHSLLGAPLPAVLPTACTLEIVHSASLIHDDLPCMDAFAILTLDALFPLAFQHIISQTPSGLLPQSSLLQVVAEISRTVGSTGMALGQLLDLEPTDTPVEILEKKFGVMAECSAACGGIIGGATEEEMGRLRKYGRTVGVLYQLVDDVLMEEATMRSSASVVKAVGMERALEMVEELRTAAKKELEQGFGDRYGDRLLPLYSFVDYAVERGFDVSEDVAS